MSANQPLEGRVALVTGASSGIGHATAQALAADGADLAFAARSEDKLESLAAQLETEHGTQTLVAPTNVRDEHDVEATVEATVETFGRLDIVVLNAGVGAPGSRPEDTSTEEYRTLMETHVDGTFFTVRATVPHLRDTGGNLIFMSSIAGQYPRPATPLYAATKWWIRGYALSIEGMVAEDDVSVTVVNPAEVRTGIEVLGTAIDERFGEGEVSEPEEVADAVAFAARQQGPSTVAELDLYYRGKLGQF
ncbi:SDR family oxidoreductase [Haladaptatus halobius]|uniref:SDR family oxidoreductase n=1 Tax=Haladaptatus halobius TaxID=2884875 RepID=UPI001D0A3222|nr:SDR family oxidoreductase [Haladaptatus halobius]